MFSITAPFWLTRISPFFGVRCDPGLTPVVLASGHPFVDAAGADDEEDGDDDADEECECEGEGEEGEDEEGEDAEDDEETARPEALGDAVVAITCD
ncbi:hypothetical protein ABH935_009673 [Catenulispora sp. GAS73]|uniref:hypothetical protein n=1 Tax=Catenulispora sp. GAS73 TaxID=3156269 RepID=UPI003515AD33